MKFLFLTDSHFRGKNPINRKGNFTYHLFEKHVEAMKLSKQLDCDFVLHGGDLFDSPIVALNLCDMLVDSIEEMAIPWHIVRGNHDEMGHNPNLSGATMLDHIFRRSPLINHLDDMTIGQNYIKGYDYYHGIEEDIREAGLFAKTEVTGKKIAIVHAYLVDKAVPFEHALIENIKTNYDLVLIGHYHSQVGPKKIGNTVYLCPGSMARLTISKGDIERTPQVVFIDTDIPKMKIIPLKSARSSEDVFYLDRLQGEKEYKRDIDEFIDSLESTKFQSLNLMNIIAEVAKKNAVGKDVVDEITKRITEAEVAIGF